MMSRFAKKQTASKQFMAIKRRFYFFLNSKKIKIPTILANVEFVKNLFDCLIVNLGLIFRLERSLEIRSSMARINRNYK